MGWKKHFPYLLRITLLAGWARLVLNIGRVPKRRVLPTAQELEERERCVSGSPGLSPHHQLLRQEVLAMGRPSSLLAQATGAARSEAHRCAIDSSSNGG